MDRLGALDATFLHIETEYAHLHVGSLMILEGPPPSYEDFVEGARSRLHLVPRYRQVIKSLPLGIGGPVWVDDPHFTLEYHIRHSALPAPGDDDQLRRLFARVMGGHLDINRPLWEMWLVEGAHDGRWALISKIHHAMIDGATGADMLAALLDPRPVTGGHTEQPWTPAPAPSNLALAADAAAQAVTAPVRMAARVATSIKEDPQAVALKAAAAIKGASKLGSLASPVDKTLNGPISPHRRFATTTVTLDDVREIRRNIGGTVNDVVLALAASGLRRLLLSRDGEVAPDKLLRTMVPVNVRKPSEKGEQNNRVAAMFADLPVGIADPVERLMTIHEEMNTLKRSGQAVSAQTMVQAGDFLSPSVLALAGRLLAGSSQSSVNTVTTNVPGPQLKLYLGGRELVSMYPYLPLAQQIRASTAVFSYNGVLFFGVTGDYDAVPDVEEITAGIDEGMAELLAAARAKAASEGA